MDSVTFPPYRECVEYIADRWTVDGKLPTLVSNFFAIDPDHRYYRGYLGYTLGHKFFGYKE